MAAALDRLYTFGAHRFLSEAKANRQQLAPAAVRFDFGGA